MAVKIAINGLGRIGRLVLRQALQKSQLEVVAVNDIVPPDNLAYLLKYDSTHGRMEAEISAGDDRLIINGKAILAFSEKDPSKLPWKKLGVDYVVESTGLFADKEGAEKHLQAGAKRVIITAPAKDQVP